MSRSGASKRQAPPARATGPVPRRFTMPPPANDNRPPFGTVLATLLKWGLVFALIGAGLYWLL